MERLKVAGADIEIRREGAGRPLLFLHGEDYFEQQRPFLDKLAGTIAASRDDTELARALTAIRSALSC